MSKKILYLVPIIFLLAAGYYLQKNLGKNTYAGSKTNTDTTLESSVEVFGEVARLSSLSQRIRCIATLSAIQRGGITSEISTRVEKLPVSEGESVDKGDTLIILNDDLFTIELDKVRGDFFKALTEFISELQLADSQKATDWNAYLDQAVNERTIPPLPNSPSQSKLMSIVRHGLHNHYALVKQNEQKLRQCLITAPFRGIVSNIQTYRGANVSPGTVLFTLTDLSQIRVEIDLLEEDLQYVRNGTPFQFADESSDTFYVSAINPQIDTETHSGKAIAIIPNDDMKYKDGQRVMVSLVKQVYEDRLIIPRSAILTRNDRDLVFVVKNGLAKWQYVELGVANPDYVEIIEGITEGDTVATGGHYSLAHNAPVKVNLVPR